ncbi:MAG: formyltetrahydrofolate deformylase [Epsilonproteobacteria bacterium]|nr:formyltetrahydrofolate deformylase [Campylobacterota bacterium]
MNEYRLLIDTTDKKGLVYNISKILFNYDLNIETNSEYVDKDVNKFFMRTVISGKFDKTKLLEDIKSVLPEDATIRLFKSTKKDIVILATKEAHCLGDILIRYVSGELNANIKAVIANHDTLQNLVEKFNIPFVYISHENVDRETHEKMVVKAIDEFNPQIIVLAKYMRILNPLFVDHFKDKILNIHHSFLPAFIGANPYKQAWERGVKIIGATAHYVTSDLDEGPIVSQDIVRVDHTYSWQDMRDAGRNVEKVVLSNALSLLLNDRVFVYGNKTVIL